MPAATQITISLSPNSGLAAKLCGTLDKYGHWDVPDAADIFYVMVTEARDGDADSPIEVAYEIAGQQRTVASYPHIHTISELARHIEAVTKVVTVR